jgi:hypothetical protein
MGPLNPKEIASLREILPIFTNLDFQILLVVNTENISVRDLKQSRENKATSKKN